MTKLTVKYLDSLNTKHIGKRLTDGGGLYGIVKPRADTVSILFRWRYRFDGKLKDYSCGTYPNDNITDIRKRRDEAKRLVSNGLDPQELKTTNRLKQHADQAEEKAQQISRLQQISELQARTTVIELFNRWEQLELCNYKDKGKEIRRKFEKDVFPFIGQMAVEDVKKAHISSIVDEVLTLSRYISRFRITRRSRAIYRSNTVSIAIQS